MHIPSPQGTLQSRFLFLLRFIASLRHKFLSSTFRKYQTYYDICKYADSLGSTLGGYRKGQGRWAEGEGDGEGKVEGAYVVVVHSTDMICLNTSIHLPDPLSFISPDSSVIRATCGSPIQAQANPPLTFPPLRGASEDTMEILSSV